MVQCSLFVGPIAMKPPLICLYVLDPLSLLLLMCKSDKVMGRKISNSLQVMARSLGVEEGAYFNLRKAVLEHLDGKTGSRHATIALSPPSIDRFLEAFVDQPIAKQYARILENLDSAHNETYDKAIPVLRKLTYEWIRNLKKKNKGKKVSYRQAAVTSEVSVPRPTMTDFEEEQDSPWILRSDLEATPGSTSRIEPDNATFLLASTRDETVRPNSPDIAFTTDLPLAGSVSPQDHSRNRDCSSSSQLRIENDDVTRTGRSDAKRTYDQVLLDDRSVHDVEEQTDEEDEQPHQIVSRNRAGKRVRRNGTESPTIVYSEWAARTAALPTTHGNARSALLAPQQSTPCGDELRFWLNLFLFTIRERRRSIVEGPEAENLGADEEEFLEFVLNTFDELHTDLQEIIAKVSPRLAS